MSRLGRFPGFRSCLSRRQDLFPNIVHVPQIEARRVFPPACIDRSTPVAEAFLFETVEKTAFVRHCHHEHGLRRKAEIDDGS